MVKLTEPLQTKLLHFLELGVPIKYACQAVGIDERTYYVWMKLGKRDKDRPDSKYFQFLQSVDSIPARCLARKLLHLEQASANGSVSATIWFLEHRYPEIFKQPSDVNLNIKPDVTAFIAFLNGAEYKKMRDKKKQEEKALATTTQSNDAMRQPNTNGVVQMLPPPVNDPLEEEPDDLEPVEEDEECQK
jgi:hypothetical protein